MSRIWLILFGRFAVELFGSRLWIQFNKAFYGSGEMLCVLNSVQSGSTSFGSETPKAVNRRRWFAFFQKFILPIRSWINPLLFPAMFVVKKFIPDSFAGLSLWIV